MPAAIEVDLGRIARAFSMQTLLAIVRDPQTHLLEATVLVAIVALGGVILTLLALIMMTERQSAKRAPRGEATRKHRRRSTLKERSLIVGATLAAALLAAAAYGWDRAGAIETCVRCHGRQEMMTAWREDVHSSVRCMDCHASAGVLASASWRLAVANDSARALLGLPERRRDPLTPDRACTACHDVSGTLSVGTLRVSHAEISEAGIACVSCHASVGHAGKNSRPGEPKMSACVICHDGRRASSQCGTCHVGDPAVVATSKMRDYPKVAPLGAPRSCRGCHPIDKCTACHGLELPHPVGFRTSHAAMAAFERKRLCSKCHALERFCNNCHDFPDGGRPAHGEDWKTLHAEDPTGCGCHHMAREPFCALCH